MYCSLRLIEIIGDFLKDGKPVNINGKMRT